MPLNRFRFEVLVRVLLLSLTLAGAVWLILATDYVMTVALAGVVVVVQVVALIRRVEKVERDLTRFLIAVRYEDFFETFGTSTTPTASRLHDEFTRIMSEFRRVRAEREEQVQYLQTVLQHIGTAVLSYDSHGDVELANSAARKLFHANRLAHIDRLAGFSPDVVEVLKTIQAGQQRVVKVMDEGELLQLLIRATEFVRGGRRLTLVVIQNIRGELEEKELEAWQNLIRVLTHEIRNSITPIASLATTANGLLGEVGGDDVDPEDLEDVRLAARTIQKRSEGLLRFVEVFRSLYKVPEPELDTLEITPFFEHLDTLFAQRFAEAGVQVEWRVHPESLDVLADGDLIEQVMINLLTNAEQALAGRDGGRIRVDAGIDARGRARIRIADNGPGVPPDLLDRIFIPFFTTKPEGTGVGLSLSRQIMRMHRGTITVQSDPGEGAVFRLVF